VEKFSITSRHLHANTLAPAPHILSVPFTHAIAHAVSLAQALISISPHFCSHFGVRASVEAGVQYRETEWANAWAKGMASGDESVGAEVWSRGNGCTLAHVLAQRLTPTSAPASALSPTCATVLSAAFVHYRECIRRQQGLKRSDNNGMNTHGYLVGAVLFVALFFFLFFPFFHLECAVHTANLM